MSAPLVSHAGPDRNMVGDRTAALRRDEHAGVALYLGALALVALLYYGAGRIGLELAYLDGAVAALWPPAGLGLAVLFLYGLRLWPAIVIGDLALGDFSTPLGTVLAQTLGNTLALVVAALLLRRLTDGRGGLERVADVLAFVTCALVAAVVSAAFGPLALRLGHVISPGQLGEAFRTWTLGGGAGGVAAAARCALHRLPGAVVGGGALRAARGGHGHLRGVLDHGLEHGAERRAVRARLDHRQPARDAALHRHLGAHVAGPRGGDSRAHAGRGGAGRKRGVSACARGRAGGTAPSRDARGERSAAEPRVRAGDRGGRPAAGHAGSERHALRRRPDGDRRRWLERGRRAQSPGRQHVRPRRRHRRREGPA